MTPNLTFKSFKTSSKGTNVYPEDWETRRIGVSGLEEFRLRESRSEESGIGESRLEDWKTGRVEDSDLRHWMAVKSVIEGSD